jgi:hypothetical protein
MKATIIGSDLLQTGDSVKFLEINTNTTIYNDGAELLDYTSLFDMLNTNNITEFHFIWTEGDSYLPLIEGYKFKKTLEAKCIENNISFTDYSVPQGSVTVPFIEDGDNKFILRQAYDTTALVDDTYCNDKFEFFSLMGDSNHIPKTYFASDSLSLDTLDSVDYTTTSNPNVLIKARYPSYDIETYPALYRVSNITDLNAKKTTELETNYLTQEFIFSEDNLIQGRYSIIRSIDIIYGSNLDVINMGGYTQSSMLPMAFTDDEFVTDTNKLNQKSRYKYITKALKSSTTEYHTDDESVILNFNGTLTDVNTIQIGDYIRSINFTDFNDNQGANFEEGKIDTLGWDGTLQKSNETLTQMSSTLSGKTSAVVDTIYIQITLEDGRTWSDAPSCTYYIEEKDSTLTRFEKLNKLYVGDKLVITDVNTNELTTVAITGLEMVHAQKTIYGLDFEPSDLFLVDIGNGDFGVMHNGCWCPWQYCGYFCLSNSCPACSPGGGPEKI